MSKKNSKGSKKMTQAAAKRIQSSVDRKGGNQGFKSRTASAAAKNASKKGK